MNSQTSTPPPPGPRRPELRRLLLLFPLLVLAWSLWTEVSQYRHLEAQTAAQARQAAAAYAGLVAGRLDAAIETLQFAAQALLGPQTDPAAPDAGAAAALSRFLQLHPGFYAFELQAAEHGRSPGPAGEPPRQPDRNASRFTPLAFNPDGALGRIRQEQQGAVLPLRYAVRDTAGHLRYFTVASFRVKQLLRQPTTDTPWTFTLVDLRERRTADTGRGIRVPVGAYPFAIAASWPAGFVRESYVQGARTRWVQEAGSLLLLLAAYYGVLRLARRHERNAQRLQRLTEFNAMLVRANQIANTARDEPALLRPICATAVELGHLELAFVARPDERGRFQVLAAAGAIGYLEGLHLSIDPSLPEGRGSAGRAWCTNRAIYNASFARTPFLAPWHERARRFGFGASATLVIRRAGKPWAILSVYHARENVFDTDLQTLLDELALDISRGLDRIDLWQNELHLTEQLKRQALRDALTDLPNRLALLQRLPETVARARRNGGQFAVGMIDLDDFKPVNDLWGHEAGDRLLQELARRLQSRLRETDLLARLGGDEFVIVLDNIDEHLPAQSLSVALDRLHEAVETPFEVAPGQHAEVGMSIGLALYPNDATEIDALLRLADAALYQTKTHKHDRVHWWHQSTTGAPQDPATENAIDSYGADAAELLSRAKGYFAAVANAFAEAFYGRLAMEPQAHAILARLSGPEIQRLKARQAEHLRMVLDPATQRADIVRSGARLGEIHALVGVDSALLVQSLALYRRLLSEHLNRAALPSRSRYRLLLVAECRLQDDIQAELLAESDTMGRYFAALSAPLPPAGALWADISQTEMDVLGQLPGILDLAILRPDARGVFQLEAMAGPQSEAIQVITLDPRYQPNLDAHTPLGRALVSRAWHGKEVLSTAAYALDEQFSAWHEVLTPLGVRSALAIPILDARGHPVAAVRMFGAYPNQFESLWMRQFALGLQQRLNEIWQRSSTPTAAAVLPQKIAQAYRARLFAGGLIMHMQPVVDLRTGKTAKVEALARLRLEDGSLISPAAFLPLLGNADIDRLFRLGLAEVLDHLARWHGEGWTVGASVNLPPTTLLDPECVRWVREALERSRVPAGSLTLEILETHAFDAGVQDAAIAKLLDLGVKLSMDDLGSGYSSLQRLSEVPFDDIKIDQSLLRQLRADPARTLGLIGALIQMGRDFGQDVVVEGLEDPGMVEAVAVLGAPYGQGHGLARPMPAEALAAWRRDFRLPIEAGTLRTYLGALAYHWRLLHSGEPGYPGSGGKCPLARFLAERHLTDSLPGRWHAQLHQDTDRQAAGQALLNWLVERVRQEASDPQPSDAAPAAAASLDPPDVGTRP